MGRRAKPSGEACPYVSKGGLKLQFALDYFGVTVAEKIAADLGSHLGGFVDCLLQHGAAKVYAVDTCYGTLAWKVRQNPKVVVCERTNALYWQPPGLVDFVTIDVGWTRQELILSSILNHWRFCGSILSLLKPQYEMGFGNTQAGVIAEEQAQAVAERAVAWAQGKFRQVGLVFSPLRGSGGNLEAWLYLQSPIREGSEHAN